MQLRILQVNKFHFRHAGAEAYYLGVSDLLRAHGHYVGHFAMEHPENLPCDQAEHFVRQIDYAAPGGPLARLRLAAHTIYSTEARRKIAALLDAEPYDLVHLHNFHHQLTPSILSEIKRRGIPMVWTLHDYKVICPNYKMLTHDGVCERCKGHRYYQAAVHRCNKGSFAASAVNVVEMHLHHMLGSHGLVDRFHAPSRFMRDKVVAFGVPAGRVVHIPYAFSFASHEPDVRPGSYFLYLGRLSSEKGVPELIEAVRRTPGARLRITGRGPYEDEIRRLADKDGDGRLELTGHLTGEALENAIRGALAVVVPSIWYENLPFAVIEAYAYGKPVIGSRIGGITEMIEPGETGWLFEPGDVEGLAACLAEALDDPARIERMGRRGRDVALQQYDPETHYERLMAVYESLAGNRQAR